MFHCQQELRYWIVKWPCNVAVCLWLGTIAMLLEHIDWCYLCVSTAPCWSSSFFFSYSAPQLIFIIDTAPQWNGIYCTMSRVVSAISLDLVRLKVILKGIWCGPLWMRHTSALSHWQQTVSHVTQSQDHPTRDWLKRRFTTSQVRYRHKYYVQVCYR